MKIYIAKKGQQFGPYSKEQVREYVRTGHIGIHDKAWHRGRGGWTRLSSILRGLTDATAFTPVLGQAPNVVALWNPNASANWCLLFSPIFGAFLHARNWRQLGDHKRAQANMFWVYGLLALNLLSIMVAVAFPDAPDQLAARNSIGFGLLGAWYYSQAKHQIRHVKAAFPNGYKKKSLWPPVLIALAVIFLILGLVVSGEIVLSRGQSI